MCNLVVLQSEHKLRAPNIESILDNMCVHSDTAGIFQKTTSQQEKRGTRYPRASSRIPRVFRRTKQQVSIFLKHIHMFQRVLLLSCWRSANERRNRVLQFTAGVDQSDRMIFRFLYTWTKYHLRWGLASMDIFHSTGTRTPITRSMNGFKRVYSVMSEILIYWDFCFSLSNITSIFQAESLL